MQSGKKGRAFIAIALVLAVAGGVGAEEVETPPAFSAGDILPPEVASGEHHRVVEEVASDGFMYLFRIASEWGEFEARGESMLAVRIHEVNALAKLSEVSKTKVFADTAMTVATAQVETVKEFADKPVQTVKGVPGGMKRMFKKYQRDAKEGYATAKEITTDLTDGGDDAGEGDGDGAEGEGAGSMQKTKEVGSKAAEAGSDYAKRYVGYSKAERAWAQRLEVDPYTSNEVLRQEIKKVARVEAAAGLTMRFAPIPRIPGASELGKVNSMVWSMDPRELVERNMKELAAMGTGDEAIALFFESPVLTLSHQTSIVASLMALDGAADRNVVVEQAAALESPQQADFFTESLEFVVAYGRDESPIARLYGRTRVPVGLGENGTLVVGLSTDHVSWTEEVREAVDEFEEAHADVTSDRREARLRGTASELFHERMKARGWLVSERVVTEGSESGRDAP